MEGVTINLSEKKSEEFFYAALCNGGVSEFAGCGLDFHYHIDDYDKAKKVLQASLKPGDIICREDVWMEILRIGGKLKMVNTEDGDDFHEIALKDVHERVSKMPIHHLSNYINENDDAETAFVLLQQVFLNDQIYG